MIRVHNGITGNCNDIPYNGMKGKGESDGSTATQRRCNDFPCRITARRSPYQFPLHNGTSDFFHLPCGIWSTCAKWKEQHHTAEEYSAYRLLQRRLTEFIPPIGADEPFWDRHAKETKEHDSEAEEKTRIRKCVANFAFQCICIPFCGRAAIINLVPYPMKEKTLLQRCSFGRQTTSNSSCLPVPAVPFFSDLPHHRTFSHVRRLNSL